MPAAHGPPTTVHSRFTRWSRQGAWQRLFERMAAAGPVPEELCLDSTHVKAHRLAQAIREAWPDAVGISRGGATSKVHGLADPQGRPLALALMPGNTPGIHMAIPLLEGMPRPKPLIADKAVIPSLATRTFPFPLDRKACKRRNVIERLWSGLKTWRRIATRYDRLARNYLASPAPVSAVVAWT